MLKKRLLLSFAAAAGLAVAQGVDSLGVSVDVNGAMLLHRSPISYPEAARARNVKGSVTVDLTLDAAGNVTDAHVVSGPEELRKASLQSVLNWHFAHEAVGMHRQVTISFAPPSGRQREDLAKEVDAEERLRTLQAEMRKKADAAAPQRNLQSIRVLGLSDTLSAELIGKLPIHEGDALTPEAMERASKVVREFDEHMTISTAVATNGGAVLQIGSPDARAMARAENFATTPQRIRVGGNVQSARLVQQARPVYPPEAKQSRIQGVVQLSAVIGRDGTILQLEVISGHPLLVPSALDAVKQWVYQPTLLNGNPVEVVTQIDVNYTLSQ